MIIKQRIKYINNGSIQSLFSPQSISFNNSFENVNDMIKRKELKDYLHEVEIWINKNIHEYEFSELKEDFNELQHVLKDIIEEQDFSHVSYEDIQYLLRPFEEQLPLKIKRYFNIAMMDHYTMFIASRHFESIEDFINLEMCTRRFQGNMTKFHYNPIPLTSNIKHFFSHLQTLYLYYPTDNQFEEDEKIIARKRFHNLSYEQALQIEEWTNKSFGNIIFDTRRDGYKDNNDHFNKRIIGKKHLLFLIESKEKEKFGYYLDTEVENILGRRIATSKESFHFNIQSNNNRLPSMMKFNLLDEINGGYNLSDGSGGNFITLGEIYLKRGFYLSSSRCFQHEKFFEYYSIPNALCGKTHYDGGNFIPIRIQVIQMY